MQSADYERIKSIIGDIYEENSDFLNDIPVDIFGLARKMGFRLIKASDRVKIGKEKAKEFVEINANKDIFGYTFFDRKNMQYVIYYDDLNAGEYKQRFSVAHEIGHIVLGHIDKGIDNYEEAEKEVNYFAGYILCPDCLSTNEEIYKSLRSDINLMSILFGISEDTALIKFDHHYNRRFLPEQRFRGYEKNIMNCLEEAVLTKIRD